MKKEENRVFGLFFMKMEQKKKRENIKMEKNKESGSIFLKVEKKNKKEII